MLKWEELWYLDFIAYIIHYTFAFLSMSIPVHNIDYLIISEFSRRSFWELTLGDNYSELGTRADQQAEDCSSLVENLTSFKKYVWA